MTDDDMTDIVLEEVTDQMDADDLVSGGSIKDQLDPDKLGAAVGARVGESIGRTAGQSVGRHVSIAINESIRGDADGDEAPLSVIKGAFRSGMQEAINEIGDRDSTVSSLLNALPDSEGDGDLLEEDDEPAGEETDEDASTTEDAGEDETTEDKADDGQEGAKERDDEEAHEDGKEADEDEVSEDEEVDGDEVGDDKAADAEDVAASVDPDEADAAELSELRTETLESYLELLSYRELQSIAKEVGVKGNLKRAEMTDRIVDTVAEST
ncbi:hypothetical protein OB919_16190 [Halobacteria archaeon AArc-curdl1]|uniref:Uncharacterized protein n=1 Tax=Natronosalvus hydrolyticus TaxID=2979988 RepID=A0AAP3E824_9EURY|nr:hypothetical protein [Halobacteria archaeon AArc-curdl1]